MNTTTQLVPASPTDSPDRYQIYRQARNGCHHPYGRRIHYAFEAVEVFLAAAPIYEGGAIHLWDHRKGCAVASTAWTVEKTYFGFSVHTRNNIFNDTVTRDIAQVLSEREHLIASLREEV